jgi:N6-adenosine-specific RNA methylase IME4
MIPFPNKKYSIILADPPWSYRNGRGHPRWAGDVAPHYDTMTIDEIKALPVADLAENDSILFLWVTFPNLQEGLDTLAAWGFNYKTLGFSWIKLNPKAKTPFFGVGYYTKSNCEVCLIGTRGKPPKQSNKVSSVILAPREEHSKKPETVREKIVELCGDLPRIELFARGQAAPGWDAWGNEVDQEEAAANE